MLLFIVKIYFFFDFSLPVATNDPKLGNSWFSSFLWSHHGCLHYFQSNDLSKYRTFALNKIIFLIFLISRSVSIIFLTESTHNRQKTEFFKVFLTEYPWENTISAQYFATKIPLCSIHIVYHPLQERYHIFKRALEAPNTRDGGIFFFGLMRFAHFVFRASWLSYLYPWLFCRLLVCVMRLTFCTNFFRISKLERCRWIDFCCWHCFSGICWSSNPVSNDYSAKNIPLC